MKWRRQGYSLIELLSVMGLIALMLVWLISALEGVYRDYRIRIAFEQAIQDLRVIEIMRSSRSEISVNSVSKAALAAGEFNGMGYFLDSMEVVSHWPTFQLQAPSYHVNRYSSAVTLVFSAGDIKPVALSGGNMTTDDDTGITSVTLFSRQTDPLIPAYLGPSLQTNKVLGY